MLLAPRLNPGTFAFVMVSAAAELDGLDVVATMREDEGLTGVVPVDQAEARGLTPLFRAAWITCSANTALDAVGITARFAKALAAADIACNVIAGVCHDHVFVPVERAADAVDVLCRME